MIKKTIFTFILFVVFSPQISYSQTVPKLIKKQSALTQFLQDEKVAIKLDYFGELGLHPGMSFGIDYTIAKKKWVTLHWDSELGGYWHRWNNTSLFLKSSIGSRLPIKSLFVDLNLGAGYMHSFPAGTVYRKASDGGVEKAPNWGSPHFISTFSVLVGYDGTRRHNLPFTIHLGPEIYYQSNFNHIFLPHVAAKLGITYKIKKK